MRIGLDARFLTHPQAGGFKTYTENLIQALSQIDNVNDYVIYVDRWSPEITSFPQNNFYYQVVDGTFPLLGMPVREQIALRGYIANDKLDVVHFLCNTAPIAMKEKYIVTLHDTIQVTDSRPFKIGRSPADHRLWAINAYSKWAITKATQYAKRIITVSNHERTQIAKCLNIALERISVTHLAPNPVFVQAAPETKAKWRATVCKKFDLQGKFILGIGFEPRKNIPLLIEVFSKIAPAHLDLRLVIIAAHQEWRLYFQRMISEMDLDNRVVILPALPPTDLVVLYNLAEVFVFPSERESFGLPPLEAMACGTPTIAMDMSSIPEILQDGAVLVNGKDLQTWVNAIEKVLANRKRRASLVDRGLRQAGKLSWHRCAQETLQVYRAVVEGN